MKKEINNAMLSLSHAAECFAEVFDVSLAEELFTPAAILLKQELAKVEKMEEVADATHQEVSAKAAEDKKAAIAQMQREAAAALEAKAVKPKVVEVEETEEEEIEEDPEPEAPLVENTTKAPVVETEEETETEETEEEETEEDPEPEAPLVETEAAVEVPVKKKVIKAKES